MGPSGERAGRTAGRTAGGTAGAAVGGIAGGTAGAAVGGIVLAGGAARRFGGADKTAEVVGGRSLLGHAVQALADAGAGTVVVVGPRLPEDVAVGCRLVLTREDPPGSGPVAGLLAGLDHVVTATVVVLAADLPGIDAAAVGVLVDGLDRQPQVDGVVATDTDGRAQWLTAAYRADALRSSARAVVAARAAPAPATGTARAAPAAASGTTAAPAPATGTTARAPGLRDVIAGIRWTGAPLPAAWGRLVDVDTPEDLSRARLDEWTTRLVDELGLQPATGGTASPVLVDLVLDLARDAAHTIARPAAPLTTFALGMAAGLAAGSRTGTGTGSRTESDGSAGPEDSAGPNGSEDAAGPADPELTALRDRILAMVERYDAG